MEITTGEKKVCENCHFIKRPFGRSLNDDCFCQKSQEFVGPIQKHSCENWKKYQPDDVFM